MFISKYISNNELNLKDLFKNIESLFNSSTDIIHFDRNVTKKVVFNGQSFAIKSFKIPNIVQSIGYANFKASKAKRSYDNSLKLLKYKINTPKPYGYIEEINNSRVYKSYYISLYHSFDFDLVPVFNNFQENEALIEEFIVFVIKMHNAGIYHHDLTRRNILINPEDKDLFSLVDNNRISFRSMSIAMRMESISKLTNNIDELKKLAIMYSKQSSYRKNECVYYIMRGFNKSQSYKKIKRFLNGK